MAHDTMEDLSLIQVNDSLRSEEERGAIIENALQKYTERQRKKRVADNCGLIFSRGNEVSLVSESQGALPSDPE